MPNRLPTPAVPSPAMGVYKFHEKINGCTAWYSRGADGAIIDFVIARPGMSEATIVSELAIGIYGARRPTLELITVRRDGDSVPWPASLTARIFRARISGAPDPTRGP